MKANRNQYTQLAINDFTEVKKNTARLDKLGTKELEMHMVESSYKREKDSMMQAIHDDFEKRSNSTSFANVSASTKDLEH